MTYIVSSGTLNPTILYYTVAVPGRQYVQVGLSRRKIPRSSAYTISEKAIRFQHLDYNPDQAQKLMSSSMSRHLSTCNISSKFVHSFLSNLANRQTDKRTQAKTCTSFVPPQLSTHSLKFHRNASIASSDITLKLKNPVQGSGL